MLKKRKHLDLADVNVYTARRLNDMAQSLGILARACEDANESGQGLTREDALASMQMAAAMVCGGCSQCNLYTDSGKEESYYPYYLLRAFEQKGQVDEADLPRFFQETCSRAKEYVRQLNRGLGRATMNLEWKNRFLESRDAVMVQFREMAVILEEFAHQMEQATDITALKGDAVKRAFSSRHMLVDNQLLLEYENEHREAYLTVRTVGRRCVTARDAAEILSRAMGGRSWYAPKDTRALVTRTAATIHFSEAGRYCMAYGIAKLPGQGEEVSGDNYSYSGNIPGQVIMSLSDGMGSGIGASRESQKVVELTEQLLEAGFSARSALKLVNTVILMAGAEQHPVTLDLACIDLRTGVLEAMKLGAPATFILDLDGSVTALEDGHAPVGILNPAEPTLLSRKLWDGERIVMVTDGILDACPGEEKEEALKEYIANLPIKSPQDMADRILSFACRHAEGARDDMTVLAAGIWKRL